MKKIIVTIIIVFLVGGIIWFYKKPSIEPIDNGPTDDTMLTGTESLCYIWNTEAGDSASLKMDLNKDKVTGGFFNFQIAFKDRKAGPIEGKIITENGNKKAELVWTATQEGVTVEEPLLINLEGNIAKPVLGGMPEAPNMLQTLCSDEAIK